MTDTAHVDMDGLTLAVTPSDELPGVSVETVSNPSSAALSSAMSRQDFNDAATGVRLGVRDGELTIGRVYGEVVDLPAAKARSRRSKPGGETEGKSAALESGGRYEEKKQWVRENFGVDL